MAQARALGAAEMEQILEHVNPVDTHTATAALFC